MISYVIENMNSVIEKWRVSSIEYTDGLNLSVISFVFNTMNNARKNGTITMLSGGR
jgi:hypothetical protein